MPALREVGQVVPEKFLKGDAGVMCDYRLTPQERVHRLCTGKVELPVGDWQALIAKVFSVDPVRAWDVIESAKTTGKMAHELLFVLRNRLPITDHGFDRSVMQRIDALILSHFQPEGFHAAGQIVKKTVIDFSI